MSTTEPGPSKSRWRLVTPFVWLFQIAIGAIGVGAYGLMLIATVFSLPLNVLALMRIFGWEWWGALIAAVLIGLIPLVGQLAYIGLAIAGAVYFYQAGFDWRATINPQTKTISVADMTPEQFGKFKKSILPDAERGCKKGALERYAVDGRLPMSMAKFCECYANTMSEILSQADFAYQETHNQISDEAMARFESAMKERCRLTETDAAQHLTGTARSDFIAGTNNSCIGSYGKGNTGAIPRQFYEHYCRCYAEGLVDHLSADELKDADSPRANSVIQEEAKRCYQIIKDEAMRNAGQK